MGNEYEYVVRKQKYLLEHTERCLNSLIIKYILNEMTFSFKPANILIQTRQTGKDLKLDTAAGCWETGKSGNSHMYTVG